MPFMYTCIYCGKEVLGHSNEYMAEWWKVEQRIYIYVCGSRPCRTKAEKAGFQRLGRVR